jgi:hypothetical protein
VYVQHTSVACRKGRQLTACRGAMLITANLMVVRRSC